MSKTENRKAMELMIYHLSKHVRDGAVIHIGAYTPLALAAALLAKLTHAPNAALDSPATLNAHVPYSIPITLRLLEGSQCSQAMQTHRQVVHIEGPDGCDFEPIAAAQIDRYGNLNNSAIGGLKKPKVRLPGPAGIDTLSSMLFRTISLYTTRHTPLTFVKDVDVVTGLGHRRNGKTRAELGYPEVGGSPTEVITNLGLFDFNGPDKHMRLVSLHPGVTIGEVRAQTGFDLPVSPELAETETPSEEIVDLIQNEVDPMDTVMMEFEPTKERLNHLRRLLNLEREQFIGVPWRWPRIDVSARAT